MATKKKTCEKSKNYWYSRAYLTNKCCLKNEPWYTLFHVPEVRLKVLIVALYIQQCTKTFKVSQNGFKKHTLEEYYTNNFFFFFFQKALEHTKLW